MTLGAGEINLDQDFGYNATTPNTISGTLWEDTNADGTLSGETGRFTGVTVALYEDTNLDGVLDERRPPASPPTPPTATATTASPTCPMAPTSWTSTDEANVLNGYWHCDGANDGSDNNSQDDPYTVSGLRRSDEHHRRLRLLPRRRQPGRLRLGRPQPRQPAEAANRASPASPFN